MKIEFSFRFPTNTQISNFMKIRPVGAELSHADRPTNTAKLVVAFRNFAKVYKNRKVGIMTRRLSGQSGFRISAGTKDFSHLHTVQTVFGAHQASPFNRKLGSLPRVKRPKREVKTWPPFRAEVKNRWSFTFHPLFVAWIGTTLPLLWN
jgi:hypothetical protein